MWVEAADMAGRRLPHRMRVDCAGSEALKSIGPSYTSKARTRPRSTLLCFSRFRWRRPHAYVHKALNDTYLNP